MQCYGSASGMENPDLGSRSTGSLNTITGVIFCMNLVAFLVMQFYAEQFTDGQHGLYQGCGSESSLLPDFGKLKRSFVTFLYIFPLRIKLFNLFRIVKIKRPVLRIRVDYPGSEFFHPGSKIFLFRIKKISIPDPNFFHPGSEIFPSRIPIPHQRI